MNAPVVVIGSGGHAKVLVDALRLAGKTIIGLTDADPGRKGSLVLGYPVLGGDEALAAYGPDDILLVNGVGGARSMAARRAVYERLRARGFRFAPVVHPAAWVSGDATLAQGAQVMAGAVIQPGARVEENAIVNTRASVDHDCRVGAHSQVAPGAVLCGAVEVGPGSLVGAGATVRQNVRIGRGCVIGAGAAVTSDVADEQTVWGVPARPVRL
ncbi:MAG: acetyltransferase [Desulfovibrionaceae bacterium]